jgi:hypothetical protein
MSRGPAPEAPIVRILVGQRVEAVFHYVAGRWSERGHMSKAQSRYLSRRSQEVSGLSSEEQADIFRKNDRGHTSARGGHRVQRIGDEPFGQAYRPEWNGVPLRNIPGYHEVFAFDRYGFEPDTLFGTLDRLREHGVTEIQLDTLRKYVRRPPAADS